MYEGICHLNRFPELVNIHSNLGVNKVFTARHVGHTEQTRALRWLLVSPSTLIPSKITYTGQLCKCDAQENTSPPEADRATLTHMHFNLGPYRVPAAVADNLSHQRWRGEAVCQKPRAVERRLQLHCTCAPAGENHGECTASTCTHRLFSQIAPGRPKPGGPVEGGLRSSRIRTISSEESPACASSARRKPSAPGASVPLGRMELEPA